MRRVLPIALGLLMIAVGVLWTLQGLGYLKGSVMTGVAVWAVIGPLVAGFGVALTFVGARRPGR
jgi:multisubunit Na+/H+ antiporter MnhB subunit